MMKKGAEVDQHPTSNVQHPATKNHEPRTKNRTWRLAMLAGAAILFAVVIAEIVLRLVGVPHDPDTLLRSHFVSGKDGWMVTRPLYTRIEASAHPQRFSRDKDPGVLRIALLGGSSVKLMGDAEPLAERLERAIGKEVQILNFGLCGCGTDRSLASARQALKLGVDAILLYSGHNEFISQSNRETYGKSGWLHRHSKLLQLCIGNAWVPEPGRLYSQSEKDEVYAQFDGNLRELTRLCREESVPLIWGTVASNLRISPLAYTKGQQDDEQLSPEPMTEFQRGAELYNRQSYPEAKQVLQQAISSSPRPWRATWRNNQILRDVARELSVPLADIEQRVTDASEQGIPGYRLFRDHCHLDADGYAILMDAFAEALVQELSNAERGIVDIGKDWDGCGTRTSG